MAGYSDRAIAPAETLRRVQPLLANFGITRVARHTSLDCIGVPVWCAYTPNARSIVVAQGKGLTDDDAKVSAVMEALERAVAGKPAVDTFWASARQLRNSGLVFDTLDGLVGLGRNRIALDDKIEWVLAKELMSETTIHVPFDAIVLDRTRDNRFWMSSDGLASGNTLEEAIFHGVLERIERDAYVLWQVGSDERRYSRCVDPGGFQDPALDHLTEKIEAAGLTLRLFDITSDIAIPCFSAILAPGSIACDPHVRFVEVTGGSGAHPSPVRAAIRAVTEAIQSRLTYISGARDDVSPETFFAPLPAQTRSAFAIKPGPLVTGSPSGQKPLPQYLSQVLDRLRARQIERVIALRLSDSSLPFDVVKILIPDLENPDGRRARRFGNRAIAAAIMS